MRRSGVRSSSSPPPIIQAPSNPLDQTGGFVFSAPATAANSACHRIEAPPYLWNESQLWQAYVALNASQVKGASGRCIFTDLVSLVRFAIHQDNELCRSPSAPRPWLEMIRDHNIAANLGIEPDYFEYAPFAQESGGLGRVYQLFGNELNTRFEQLNESLAA